MASVEEFAVNDRGNCVLVSVWEFTFLATGAVEEQFAPRVYYVMGDGTLLRTETDFVWCNHCRKITDSEQIEPLEELDSDLAGLEQSFANMPEAYREHVTELYRSEYVNRRRWLVDRVSPAKCILCGETDFVSLQGQEVTETPRGKVTARVTRRAAVRFLTIFLAPEGERIEYTPPATERQSPRTPPPRPWWQF